MLEEPLDTLKQSLKLSGPLLLVVIVLAYFLKRFLEKSMDAGFSHFERRADEAAKQAERRADEAARQRQRQAEALEAKIENIGRTSLDVKKELRGEEREELVALRVAVDKWEYFLQTAVMEFTLTDPAKADVRTLIDKDTTLFQDVRIAVVRTSTYLRDPYLETKLMNAIIKVRKIYYPLINEAIPKLIDLQGQLRLIDNKLQAFQQSGMKDLVFAPTENDRQENLRLQNLMTAEVSQFAEKFMGEYRSIAELMVELKSEINEYIYRPMKETDIDKE